MIDRVAAMIERACPGSDITEILPRTGGQLSGVFEVRRVADEPVIVKVYPAEWAWKQSKELHIYRLLAPTLGDLVPSVVAAEPAGPDFDLAFTVLTKVPGVPLSETQLPDWRSVYLQIGTILRRIHRLRQPAFGYLTDRLIEPVATNVEYMDRQFGKKLREFQQLGGDRALHGDLTRYAAAHRATFAASTSPRLCHNDFHEGNILVDEETGRVTGFVDVENAIAADPLMDLAKTDCYSIRGNQTKTAGLVDGYGDLPPDFATRFAVYRVYHWLELWDWFASIGNTESLENLAADLEAAMASDTGLPS